MGDERDCGWALLGVDCYGGHNEHKESGDLACGSAVAGLMDFTGRLHQALSFP